MSDFLLFVEDPPNVFKCTNSNCYTNMIVAMTVKCGHSFCKKCALSLDKCPLDNFKIDKKNVFPNLALSIQIQEMFVHCVNGVIYSQINNQLEIDSFGCQETFQLKNKEIHEAQCLHRIVKCPFFGDKCKEKIKLKDIELHKQKCKSSHKTSNVFIHAKSDKFPQELSQKPQLPIPNNSPNMQQIADSLTLRVKRLETQMNGSLNRMENMFYEIHMGIKLILDHLNVPSDQMENNDIELRYDVNNNFCRNYSQQKNYSLSLKDMAKISGVKFNTRGFTDVYPSSHWICPFSFLNAGILKGHRKMITCLSQFENCIITGSHDQTIRIWDISSLIKGEFGKTLTNGGCIGILTGHDYSISCLTLSSFSREIISVDTESNLKIWDFSSGSLVREKEKIHEKITTSVVVSRLIIFTGSNSEIKMWNLKSLEQIGSVTEHINHFIHCMTINQPQESHLYSSGHNQVLVWKIELLKNSDLSAVTSVTLDLVQSIHHSFYTVNSMVISSRYIIIGTYNKNIQIFNINTGEHLFSLAGHVAQVNGLCLTSSETHLVSVADDGCINIWELDRITLIQSINVGSSYCAKAVSIIGDVLFICGSDAEIKIYRYDRMFT